MTGFGTIPNISLPFGISDANMLVPLGYQQHAADDYSKTNLTLSSGLDNVHSAPGGNPITRHHMNGIGFLATIGGFLQQAGYQATFDKEPTGGWPKGAIVADVSGGDVREYLCTKDNASAPFIGTGGLNPIAQEDDSWKPVWDYQQFNFFPNYDDREIVFKKTLNPGKGSLSATISETRGWFLVSRTFDAWDDIPENNKKYLEGPRLEIRLNGMKYAYEIDQNSIDFYEGATASRLIPCNGSMNLVMSEPPESYGNVTVTVTKFGMEDI